MRVRMLRDKSEAQTPVNEDALGGGGGGVPTRRRLLAAFYDAAFSYSEEELALALRWLSLPLHLRQAGLEHVENRIDDRAEGGVLAGRE